MQSPMTHSRLEPTVQEDPSDTHHYGLAPPGARIQSLRDDCIPRHTISPRCGRARGRQCKFAKATGYTLSAAVIKPDLTEPEPSYSLRVGHRPSRTQCRPGCRTSNGGVRRPAGQHKAAPAVG